MAQAVYGSRWNDHENRLVAASYLRMLDMELAQVPFKKSDEYARLAALTGRTVKSIERKHSNVSAVMHLLGLRLVSGLQPLPNFQKSLIDAVEQELTARSSLPEWTIPTANDLVLTEISTSVPGGIATTPTGREAVRRLISKFDPAERDKANRALGRLGEQLVFDHECRKLLTANRPELARKVRWVSEEDGDGAGYDISSFEIDGKERLLEVKTTNGGDSTPFYISENERAFSDENHDSFRLVRVYQASSAPGAYIAQPPLTDHFMLNPINYRARPL